VLCRIVIEKYEDFGYVAHCPTSAGCHCQRNTTYEAIEHIQDAIRGCLCTPHEDLTSDREERASIDIAV
jgi:predicted RNase H-like HicB family nuclease